jgi:hypothetical protein
MSAETESPPTASATGCLRKLDVDDASPLTD